jgi:uncharacterized protein (DUF302 family)
MTDYGRRVVMDVEFETAVGNLSRAIRDEGLQAIARIDVRDQFWREPGHDFRRYFLILAWSPELALDALRHNLDIGTVFSTTFAVYELADGETAVVAHDNLSPVAAQPEWRQDAPVLAAIADRESEHIAGVFRRLEAGASTRLSPSPAHDVAGSARDRPSLPAIG